MTILPKTTEQPKEANRVVGEIVALVFGSMILSMVGGYLAIGDIGLLLGGTFGALVGALSGISRKMLFFARLKNR